MLALIGMTPYKFSSDEQALFGNVDALNLTNTARTQVRFFSFTGTRRLCFGFSTKHLAPQQRD